MIYAGKKIKTILIGNRVLTSAYVGSVNVYVSAKPFSECTWAEIKEIADAGLASQYFALGDTKTDTDANNVEHTFRIVQFVYGGNALLIEDMNPLRGDYTWGGETDDDGASDNYSISNVRNNSLPAVLQTYPASLRSVINETEYKVAKNSSGNELLTLSDKLFLGAEGEYFSSRTRSTVIEFENVSQFTLYSENDTNAFRIKDSVYALRSPNSGQSAQACAVSAEGGVGYIRVIYTCKVSPLFTVGDYATRTIPYIGNSTLTASYVNTWASKIQASVRAGCTKVVVPNDFLNYEGGALDAIFAAFPNMETIQSPWLNGTKTDGLSYLLKISASKATKQNVEENDISFAQYVAKAILPENVEKVGYDSLSCFANISALHVSNDTKDITINAYAFGDYDAQITLEVPDWTAPFYKSTCNLLPWTVSTYESRPNYWQTLPVSDPSVPQTVDAAYISALPDAVKEAGGVIIANDFSTDLGNATALANALAAKNVISKRGISTSRLFAYIKLDSVILDYTGSAYSPDYLESRDPQPTRTLQFTESASGSLPITQTANSQFTKRTQTSAPNILRIKTSTFEGINFYYPDAGQGASYLEIDAINVTGFGGGTPSGFNNLPIAFRSATRPTLVNANYYFRNGTSNVVLYFRDEILNDEKANAIWANNGITQSQIKSIKEYDQMLDEMD